VPAYYIVLFVPMYDLFLGTDQPPCIFIPWSRVLLEKLIGSRVVNKFPAFYALRRFITSFTTARHHSVSCRAMKW